MIKLYQKIIIYIYIYIYIYIFIYHYTKKVEFISLHILPNDIHLI